jgi:hypothetical protein
LVFKRLVIFIPFVIARKVTRWLEVDCVPFRCPPRLAPQRCSTWNMPEAFAGIVRLEVGYRGVTDQSPIIQRDDCDAVRVFAVTDRNQTDGRTTPTRSRRADISAKLRRVVTACLAWLRHGVADKYLHPKHARHFVPHVD